MPKRSDESILEHEARQRREAREEARKRAEDATKQGKGMDDVERRKVDKLAGEGSLADKLKKRRMEQERKIKRSTK